MCYIVYVYLHIYVCVVYTKSVIVCVSFIAQIEYFYFKSYMYSPLNEIISKKYHIYLLTNRIHTHTHTSEAMLFVCKWQGIHTSTRTHKRNKTFIYFLHLRKSYVLFRHTDFDTIDYYFRALFCFDVRSVCVYTVIFARAQTVQQWNCLYKIFQSQSMHGNHIILSHY